MYDLALSKPHLGSFEEREREYTHTHTHTHTHTCIQTHWNTAAAAKSHNTPEYYSVIKKMKFVAMWKDLEAIMLCEISWRRTNTV